MELLLEAAAAAALSAERGLRSSFLRSAGAVADGAGLDEFELGFLAVRQLSVDSEAVAAAGG